MSFTDTKKTPVAVLGGLRDEGLNPTPTKEQNMPMISQPMSPAKACKVRREIDNIDLYELAHGTVRQLLNTASRTGIDPSDLIRLIEEDQA